MYSVDQSYFTSLPSGAKSRILNLEYRKKLVNSLIHLIQQCSHALSIDLAQVVRFAKSIDVTRKISPKVFLLHSNLLDAIKENNVTQILDALKKISNCKKTEVYSTKVILTSILSEDWEDNFISNLRNEKIENKDKSQIVINPIINENFKKYAETISEFERKLRKLDNNLFQEYKEYVTRIKVFHGRTILAATAVRIFGAVYLRAPKTDEHQLAYFTEHLIHEVSHLHLYSLLAHDDLITNPTGELFTAPIRKDPRPLYGILHATFVLSRMIRVFRLFYADNHDEHFFSQLQNFRTQFKSGYETLQSNAKFTKKGKLIFKSLYDCAEK